MWNCKNLFLWNSKLLTLLFLGLLLGAPKAHTEEKELSPEESCRADARFEMENNARRGIEPSFANQIASSRVPRRDFSERFVLDKAFRSAGYQLVVNGKRVNAQKGKFGITVNREFIPQYNAYRFEIEGEANYLFMVDISSVGVLPGKGYRHYRWDDARADCLGLANEEERRFARANPGVDSLWDLPVRTNFGHIELLNELQKYDPKFLETLVVVEHKGRDGEGDLEKDYVHALFVRESKVGTRNGYVPDHAASKACYGNTMYAYLFSESHDIRHLVGLRESDHALGNQSPLINTSVLGEAQFVVAQYIAKYSVTQSDNVVDYYFSRSDCDCNESLHAQLKAAIDEEQKRQFRIALNEAFSAHLNANPNDIAGARKAGFTAVQEYIAKTGFDWTSVLRGDRVDVPSHLALGDAQETIRTALNEDHINKSIKDGGGLRVYCITENPKR